MKMKIHLWKTLLFGCLTAMLPIWAAATPIGQGAFGASATTEGFENFVPGPSVVRSLVSGDTFASGVQFLASPVQGTTPAVEDLAFGGGGCFGSLVSTAQVPEGTAFVCGNTRLTATIDDPLIFLLPANTIRVGGLTAVTGTNLGPVFMKVYDTSNTLLETVSYTDISGIGNWSTNFLGIEQLGGIARVEFVAGPTVGLLIDALIFETAAADTDGDGVLDDDDFCPDNTVIPEGVPTMGDLKPNHWALTVTGNGFDFDTVTKGKGPNRSYTIEDTAGCSCEQIIEIQGLGDGHSKHGCSISAYASGTRSNH